MGRFLSNDWVHWAAHFLLMLGLWFLFAAKVEPGEILAGIGGAALAVTGGVAVGRGMDARFKFRPAWLLETWRLPGDVLSDTVLVFKVLFRRIVLLKKPESLMRSVPFDFGGASARSAARRAIALIVTTLSPNSIVIGIDRESRSMLVHQVEESDVPEVTKRLGAR